MNEPVHRGSWPANETFAVAGNRAVLDGVHAEDTALQPSEAGRRSLVLPAFCRVFRLARNENAGRDMKIIGELADVAEANTPASGKNVSDD